MVIFMTDNGGTGGVKIHNAGLRAGKTTYYDGGHRVPCWVRWPAGKLGPARDVADPVQVQDLLPTLLELCGVPKAADAKLDGVSLAGLLRGTQPSLPERKFVVQYSRAQVAKWDACVVWGKWRLVHGKELFDATADRAQATDVAARHPEVVKAMRDHYEAWWAGTETKVNEYVPTAYLGSDAEPVVELTSADWEGIYADNDGHIRSAVGGPRGGHWNVMVEKAGEYEIALRRWPRTTQATLGAKLDADPSRGAWRQRNTLPSKAFPIAAATVTVAGQEASAKTDPAAQEVMLRVSLPAGETTLQGWFQDADGNDLCGAFFAYVRRME
jgi:arylsulfatase